MAQWNNPYPASHHPQTNHQYGTRAGLLPSPYGETNVQNKTASSFESELAKFRQEITHSDLGASRSVSRAVLPPPPSGPQRYGGRVAFAPPPNLYASSALTGGTVADVLASMPAPVSRFPPPSVPLQPSHGPQLNFVNLFNHAPVSASGPTFSAGSILQSRAPLQLPTYAALASTNATLQAQSVEKKLQDQAEMTRLALYAGKTVVTANKAMFEAQKAMVMQEKFQPVMGPTLAPTQVSRKAYADKASAKAGSSTPAGIASNKISKKQQVKQELQFVRAAGEHIWEDPTLAEWDPNDFRIFCGDLGNEVTDDILARAFRKYPSFQKAKVIREKNSKKSKGYGFVSFKDPHDYILAMKEMNGKYIGNRPIKLKKSNWKDRSVEQVADKLKEKRKFNLR